MVKVGIAIGIGVAMALPWGVCLSAEMPESFELRDAGGPRTVVGNVIIEALDGGVLLELPDERLEIIEPSTILSRAAIARPVEADTPRELGKRILAELPPGFDLLVTKHYVICFDTSRAYAQWCGALFERLHEAFQNFWTQAALDVSPPSRPLIVVIFADRHRYEAFAARDLGACLLYTSPSPRDS